MFSLIFGWSANENSKSKWSVVQKKVGTHGLVYTRKDRTIPGCIGFHFIFFKVNIELAYVDIKLSDHTLVTSLFAV
jgi:hypothetical protein